MADKKYEVQVDFTLGQQSKAKLEKDIADVQSKAGTKATAIPGQPSSKQVSEEILGPWAKEINEIEDEMGRLGAAQQKVWDAGKKASKEYATVVGDSTKAVDELASSVLKQVGSEELQTKQLKQIRARASELRAESSILRRSAADLELFSRAALVGGTAILGGIFAYANKYVKEAKEATVVTVKWKEAQDDITKSSGRIGEVLAREALPFLRQAATFMKDATTFIESHPEVVPAAIKAGEILIGIGIIGKAVQTGIRLVADALTIQSSFLRLQAARIDEANAIKYLEAAGIMSQAANKNLGGGAAGGVGATGIAAALGEATVLLGSFTGGLIITDKLFDKLEKHDVTLSDYITTFKQALAIDAKNLGDFFGKNADWSLKPGQQSGPENLGNEWFKKLGVSLGLLKDDADAAADSLDKIDLSSVANSPARDQILKAYEDYLNDEQDLLNKYNEDKKNVIANALSDELAENRKYASSVDKINSQLSSSLSKAFADFQKANAEADRQYAEQHQQILEDEADDLAKIQSDLQEKLAKLAQENSEKQAELLAARDAVGLLKQQRRNREAQNEAIRDAAKESRERREQTQRRLSDLRESYEAEKAERAVAYAERVKEIRQQAADQLKELEIQHKEEIARIRLQKNEKIKELDAQFIAERNRRYQYFVAQIRDLDASLLGEQTRRRLKQAEMLRDLDAWLISYRTHLQAGLNSLSTTNPTRDMGGYVTKGLYRMAWDGNREFVLSSSTTRAAERLLGGNLSQELIMSAFRGGIGTQANYYDQRRIDSPMSREQLSLARDTAIEAVSSILGG